MPASNQRLKLALSGRHRQSGGNRRSEAPHGGDHHDELTVQGPGSASERVRVAFLIADLPRIEGRKLDGSKTGLAVIGLGAVVGLVLALRNIQTTEPNH